MTRSAEPVLQVRDLVTRFHTERGVVNAVNGVSYDLHRGQAIGIVGESGSGKSASVLSVMGLIQAPAGRVESGEAVLDGRDLLKMGPREVAAVRGPEVGMVFQDPTTSLNPVLTIGRQLTEAVRHHAGLSRAEARTRAVETLELVGIPGASERLTEFPHQFSGGQRQRIMIAMALALSPKVLIADEPTTALDVTIQAQVVDLVKELQERLGMAIIWITHDLALVAELVQVVYVLYAGYVVEHAPVREIFRTPVHPYTRGLLAAIPGEGREDGSRLASIEGQPPDLRQVFTSCPFAPRCPYVVDRCRTERPTLEPTGPERAAACWRAEELSDPGVAHGGSG